MIRMVLDTDTYNEVDDQFAMIYALLSDDVIKVEAIHAAPFFNAKSNGPEDGMERSYDEIVRLLKVLDINRENFVFKGSKRYMGSIKTPCENDAVENLIKLAMESPIDDPLYVAAIGAPTNVSSAIIKEPKIIERIKVVWLGGHGRLWPNQREFNCQQDIVASQILYDSKVRLVQIPCRPVASHLTVSVPELKACMGESKIAKALTQLVDEALDGNPAYTRVIWDMSAIAYLVNPKWVRIHTIHSPILNDNVCFSYDDNRHFIECAYFLNRDAIFEDFYKKIRKVK